MLHRRSLGGKRISVTFIMPPFEGAEEMFLCGDFNEWNETSTRMNRGDDGSWSVTLTLEAGRSYRFRYRDDRWQWHNDPSADAYVPNVFGSEDSVLDLAAAIAAAAADAAAAKRRAPQTVSRNPQGQGKRQGRDRGGQHAQGREGPRQQGKGGPHRGPQKKKK